MWNRRCPDPVSTATSRSWPENCRVSSSWSSLSMSGRVRSREPPVVLLGIADRHRHVLGGQRGEERRKGWRHRDDGRTVGLERLEELPLPLPVLREDAPRESGHLVPQTRQGNSVRAGGGDGLNRADPQLDRLLAEKRVQQEIDHLLGRRRRSRSQRIATRTRCSRSMNAGRSWRPRRPSRRCSPAGRRWIRSPAPASWRMPGCGWTNRCGRARSLR